MRWSERMTNSFRQPVNDLKSLFLKLYGQWELKLVNRELIPIFHRDNACAKNDVCVRARVCAHAFVCLWISVFGIALSLIHRRCRLIYDYRTFVYIKYTDNDIRWPITSNKSIQYVVSLNWKWCQSFMITYLSHLHIYNRVELIIYNHISILRCLFVYRKTPPCGHASTTSSAYITVILCHLNYLPICYNTNNGVYSGHASILYYGQYVWFVIRVSFFNCGQSTCSQLLGVNGHPEVAQ